MSQTPSHPEPKAGNDQAHCGTPRSPNDAVAVPAARRRRDDVGIVHKRTVPRLLPVSIRVVTARFRLDDVGAKRNLDQNF